MKMTNYVNEQPRHGQKCSSDTNQTGHTADQHSPEQVAALAKDGSQKFGVDGDRRTIQLIVFSFGILCVIQATLNFSLRLALHFSRESSHTDCNKTGFGDQNQIPRPGQCDGLMERTLALTNDRDALEKRNTELNSKIKELEEEKARLKMQLRWLNGCTSSQTCPADWREIKSRCYFLSRESKTWEESRKYCQSRGADLVVINSEQEQRDLYRLDGDSVLLFWIGLSDTDGTYKWVDGSPLTRSFWESGQPNDGGPDNKEDCVEMYHLRPQLANWNDADCGKQQRWMCEKDPCNS
ncbi:CD209 antigen-like protein E [Channa argus]|uniref:CD209 antigen-like protein E n=1 Tax=Channa argus TaxID=215402 RepID=UPI002944D2C5|nr:hypothetical protein Q8A73_003523 [Channa argus]